MLLTFFRNENFIVTGALIVNMACLKGGLPVFPCMDQWRIQTFREGAGVGGGYVARSQKIWALKVRGSPRLHPPLRIIRRNWDLNITGRRRQRKRR